MERTDLVVAVSLTTCLRRGEVSRKSPAQASVLAQRQNEGTDLIGEKGGTRTLDPGTMSRSIGLV